MKPIIIVYSAVLAIVLLTVLVAVNKQQVQTDVATLSSFCTSSCEAAFYTTNGSEVRVDTGQSEVSFVIPEDYSGEVQYCPDSIGVRQCFVLRGSDTVYIQGGGNFSFLEPAPFDRRTRKGLSDWRQ